MLVCLLKLNQIGLGKLAQRRKHQGLVGKKVKKIMGGLAAVQQVVECCTTPVDLKC